MMGEAITGIAGEDLELGDVVCWNEEGLLMKMRSVDDKDNCAGYAPRRMVRLSKFEPACQVVHGYPNVVIRRYPPSTSAAEAV